MEEKRILELKEKAKKILNNIQIDTCLEDANLIIMLQGIEQKEMN